MQYRENLCTHALAVLTVKIGTVYQPTYDLPLAA